jgi:hypothetical protein
MSPELYHIDFYNRFATTDIHWSSSNLFQREASLRHDMVCLLLCNMEPSPEESFNN